MYIIVSGRFASKFRIPKIFLCRVLHFLHYAELNFTMVYRIKTPLSLSVNLDFALNSSHHEYHYKARGMLPTLSGGADEFYGLNVKARVIKAWSDYLTRWNAARRRKRYLGMCVFSGVLSLIRHYAQAIVAARTKKFSCPLLYENTFSP